MSGGIKLEPRSLGIKLEPRSVETKFRVFSGVRYRHIITTVYWAVVICQALCFGWIASLKPLTTSWDYYCHPVFTSGDCEDQRGGVSCPEPHSQEWNRAICLGNLRLTPLSPLSNGFTPKCFSFPASLQRRNDQRIPTDMLIFKAAFRSVLQGDAVNFTKPPSHGKPLSA